MKRNVIRAPVLGTVAATTPAFTARGGSKKEETTAVKQESSVGTKADETTKAGEPKVDETTKAGEAKADASKKDDRAADTRESTMVGTPDEMKDFAFTLADEKGTTYQLTFEQDKAPEDLSDVKTGDEVTVTCMGTISETSPFEGMIVSVKRA